MADDDTASGTTAASETPTTPDSVPDTLDVMGGASVALLGYSVVSVTGSFGITFSSDNTPSTTTGPVTKRLPTGFVPYAVLGQGCYTRTKSGSTYSLTPKNPTVAIGCDSATGNYTVSITPASNTPVGATVNVFIVGKN